MLFEARSIDNHALNVGIIGHMDGGKTTLCAATIKVCAEAFGPYDGHELDQAGITLKPSRLGFKSPVRDYILTDPPGHQGYVGNLMASARKMDAVILVCSASEGLQPQTHEHVLLCSQIGVKSIVVFLNKAEMAPDPVSLESIEEDIRAMLVKHGYPGVDTPVIKGSAKMVLSGLDDKGLGATSIKTLVTALDRIPTPSPSVDGPFLMVIGDVFQIQGKGSVVSGVVDRGSLEAGEKVDIVGFDSKETVEVLGIETYRNRSPGRAVAGGIVGILLGEQSPSVRRGQVLAASGSMTAFSSLLAHVCMLTEEECPQARPFFNEDLAQFYFQAVDVAGHFKLPDGVDMISPGESLTVQIELVSDIAMEPGQKIAIREGGRTLGFGVVLEMK